MSELRSFAKKGDGRPGLSSITVRPYGLCGRKAALNERCHVGRLKTALTRREVSKMAANTPSCGEVENGTVEENTSIRRTGRLKIVRVGRGL